MAEKKPIKLNDQQLMLMASNVADLYHQLSNDLFDNVVDRLKERGTYYLDQQPYLWQLEKMNDMGLLNDINVGLLAEYSGIAEEQIRYIIENEGYKVYTDTMAQLGSNAYNNQVMQDLISYSNQAIKDVNNLINTTLPKSVQAAYKDIVEKTVAKVVTGLATPETALNETIMQWHARGFYGYTDAAGRRQRADSYARTIIRTTVNRVNNEMRTRPAEELGIDTFYYGIKSAAREMCAYIQGKIVTKGEARTEAGHKIYSLLEYGYGRPEGCQGINCTHPMTPFIPGVNYLPEVDEELKELTPEQAIKNANAQAKQRQLERNIRFTKEQIHVAEKLGDPELIDRYKMKLGRQKTALKAYLDEHKFLHRDRARERYYYDEKSVENLYKVVDKRLKKEYSKILQNLGSRAPKSYSEFKTLNIAQKRDLRHSHRVVRYFKGDIDEPLSENQKKQAVEAYFNFKKDGILFGDHGVARYIERMRRKDGTFKYNYQSVLNIFEQEPRYTSTRNGKVRDVRYNDNVIIYSESGTLNVVSMILRSSRKRGKDVPHKDWEAISYDSD